MTYTVQEYEADAEMYFDLYKEAYGHRPRHATPSMDQMQAIMEEIDRVRAINTAYERIGHIYKQWQFEYNVRYHMKREGITRAEAVRYEMHRAMNPSNQPFMSVGTDIDVFIDFEYACYCLGLDYALAGQLKLDYHLGMN